MNKPTQDEMQAFLKKAKDEIQESENAFLKKFFPLTTSELCIIICIKQAMLNKLIEELPEKTKEDIPEGVALFTKTIGTVVVREK